MFPLIQIIACKLSNIMIQRMLENVKQKCLTFLFLLQVVKKSNFQNILFTTRPQGGGEYVLSNLRQSFNKYIL